MSVDAGMLDSYESLSDAERVELGRALFALTGSEGWKLLMRLVELAKRDAAMAAVRDETRPTVYYRGRIDALEELGTAIALAIENADVLSARPTTRPGAALLKHISRPGGGDPIG